MKTQVNKQIHIPVLCKEVIDNLDIKPNGTYIDCTAGFGGHSGEILKRLKNGKLICIDQDINAIKYLNKLFKGKVNVQIIQNNFNNLSEIVKEQVDGILFDLGVSSLMFDDAKRGFSYKLDGPLDMRMNQDSQLTAKQIINTYTRVQLIDLFQKYGEDANISKVVSNIVKYREIKPIETTLELANIIGDSIKGSKIRKHPAKTYFQALRIEVNKELEVLQNALTQASKLLKKKGRIAIITFHSLEDRIVKNYFKQLSEVRDEYGKDCPIVKLTNPDFKLITKKPIIPTDEEIMQNIRSHSAKLRIIERI